MPVNTISYYTFASPRYHSVVNAETILIPENYTHHDSVLGTYDMNFPLYAITESSIPNIELITQDSTFSNVKGALAPFLGQANYKTIVIGKQITQSIPTNSNLDSKTIKYDEYLHIKLNPAWCVIQNLYVLLTDDNPVYKPRFLVRILGNSLLSKQLYALELQDSKLGALHITFPKGIIVNYKNYLWKCTKETNLYPPDKGDVESDFWISLSNRVNVFSADLFAINGTKTDYFMEVNDDSRFFNPLMKDDTLVSWNLAYWQE